jgi:hypothetical protein
LFGTCAAESIEASCNSAKGLLVINGDSDNRTPLPGLKECTDAAAKAYNATGASDHFVIRIEEEIGHKVTPESQQVMIEGFVKWLKP